MAEYVKREDIDAVLRKIAKDYYGSEMSSVAAMHAQVRLLSGLPAADVRENVHSSWQLLKFNDGTTYANCLRCRTMQVFYGGKEPTNFCPNCGADMRKVGDDI